MKISFKIILIILSFFVGFKVFALTCEDGKYLINYNANKGKSSLKKECIIDTLSTVKPTRSGYAFLGWNIDSKAKTALYRQGEKIDIDNNITLYAIWSKGFKVYFNYNGGKVIKKSKTVYKYVKYGSLPMPTRKGYTFLGWYTKKTGGSLITKSNIVNKSKPYTIYAHWKKKKYSIKYELNGGTNNKKNITTYNIKTKTFTLKNPTKKGYIFKGWFTDKKFKKKITKIVKGTTGNKTIYSKWSPIKYNIEFVGNGNTSGKMANQKGLKYATKYKLNKNKFVKKGYVFDSWNTKKDGSGERYNNEDYVSKLISKNKKTIKLYAIWKLPEYSIMYELDGGINNENAVNTYTKADEIELLNPTKEGYTFKGWYLEETFENIVTKIEKGSVGNKKFYAKWEKNKYFITYELNGGINNENVVYEYTIEDEIELLDPTKKGYTFEGWYLEETFENKVTGIEIGSTGNKKFYAKWEKNKYSITYELNGGINNENAINEYTIEDEIELLDPTKKGYTFEGWYLEETFENKVTGIEIGSTGNKKFYAKWEKNKYSITYELNGGTNNENAINEYTIEDEIELLDPTKKGYTFEGWYLEETFENQIDCIEVGSTGNKKFYAKWDIIEYSITYELNGGTNNENAVIKYTIEDKIELLDPTKEGYTFEGWYLEETFENKVTGIEIGSTSNKKFYAKWYKIYSVGELVTIDNEKFYVILDDFENDSVSLFAKYNLGTNYKQSSTNNLKTLADSGNWEIGDIDIMLYDGNAKTYIENYVDYLKSYLNNNNVSGTLITKSELGELGCALSTNTCNNSSNKNSSWIVNNQKFWTRTCHSTKSYGCYSVNDNGNIFSNNEYGTYGIRPVIIISKEALN